MHVFALQRPDACKNGVWKKSLGIFFYIYIRQGDKEKDRARRVCLPALCHGFFLSVTLWNELQWTVIIASEEKTDAKWG